MAVATNCDWNSLPEDSPAGALVRRVLHGGEPGVDDSGGAAASDGACAARGALDRKENAGRGGGRGAADQSDDRLAEIAPPLPDDLRAAFVGRVTAAFGAQLDALRKEASFKGDAREMASLAEAIAAGAYALGSVERQMEVDASGRGGGGAGSASSAPSAPATPRAAAQERPAGAHEEKEGAGGDATVEAKTPKAAKSAKKAKKEKKEKKAKSEKKSKRRRVEE